MPGYAVYAATKAAIVSVTMSVSAEVPPGVRVHALCPDGVQTAMLDAQDKAGLGSQLVHSGGRILTVDETADAAVALVGSTPGGAQPADLARGGDPDVDPRAVGGPARRPAVRGPRPPGDREESRPAPHLSAEPDGPWCEVVSEPSALDELPRTAVFGLPTVPSVTLSRRTMVTVLGMPL